MKQSSQIFLYLGERFFLCFPSLTFPPDTALISCLHSPCCCCRLHSLPFIQELGIWAQQFISAIHYFSLFSSPAPSFLCFLYPPTGCFVGYSTCSDMDYPQATATFGGCHQLCHTVPETPLPCSFSAFGTLH